MSAWNIQVSEVNGVLRNVSGLIGDEEGTTGLSGEYTDLGTRLEEVNSAASSIPISIALGEFGTHFLGVVGEMITLSASATGGAGEATMHYANGNLEMAENAQANAGTVPGPPAIQPH
ncbi:DUF6507 family protein [Nocardiopsis dassonvillei]|uniref:Uncharacterized protein n=1 Tax=Nocardiopsis dassonvillei (strain ATCC 23218 / DSM 43111 / CIP 107115 / JCM 7437 / KCTC 9190 / NBRC 14626 / NCTC 10488 / NRRL B-5397 / IMRU 509) TaxID=446468 RepID=D7AYS3_NOCDD|nr:DUF6507 family protein [Nocardiopsis dassonvillei]ADH68085.1 conserved hypothetical protein [Nocardiopsis dassonvillei subsp. dassonvillei DSM 43111]NKY77269.1 hypothetical protein [Nocardiopsis dassonvillei]VEI88585.1 Uncharacterised protein [Nocardiopsis dassonvillei]